MWVRYRRQGDPTWVRDWHEFKGDSFVTAPPFVYEICPMEPKEPFKPGLFRRPDLPEVGRSEVAWFEKEPGVGWIRVGNPS